MKLKTRFQKVISGIATVLLLLSYIPSVAFAAVSETPLNLVGSMGFTDNGNPLELVDGGWRLTINGDSTVTHNLDFAGVGVSEGINLSPLKLTYTTAVNADLVAYYNLKPSPYKEYLLGALAGDNPFVYVGVTGTDPYVAHLYDAAIYEYAHVLVPMRVPDNFIKGSYTVSGELLGTDGDKMGLTLDLLVVENGAPTVPILLSPEDGKTVKTIDLLSFQWTSLDIEGDGIEYKFQIGYGDKMDAIKTDSSFNNLSSFSFPAEFTPYGDGTYYWWAKSRDSLGHESDWSEVRSFTIDSINPIISGENASPTPFSPKNVDGVKDVTTLGYNLSEDAKVKVDVLNESDSLVRSLVVDFAKLAGPNSDVWDGKNAEGAFVEDGVYTLTIDAYDVALNNAVKEFATVRVDNTAPVIVEMKDIRTNVAEKLEGSATDYSNEINYKWKKVSGPDGGVITFVNDIDPVTEVTATLDGEYVLELSATDLAGNTSVREIKFTWDTTVNPVTDLYVVQGDAYVDLHWTNPTDKDLAGVKILRSISGESTWYELAVLNHGEILYQDEAVLNGVAYNYKVVAFDELGNKSEKEISATPQIALVTLEEEEVKPFTYGYSSNAPKQVEEKVTQEVKSEEKEGDVVEKEENKNLPAVGVGILVLLALVGLYLLYLQNPNWFGFLKKKKSNVKKLK